MGFNKTLAVILLAISAAILLGFTFVSTIYWYILDAIIVLVNVSAATMLLKKK